MGGGADMLLIPEVPVRPRGRRAGTCGIATCRRRRSRSSSWPRGRCRCPGTLEMPPYPLDANGFPRLGGISEAIAPEIERRTGLPDPGHDPRSRPARRVAGGVRPRARRRGSGSRPSSSRRRAAGAGWSRVTGRTWSTSRSTRRRARARWCRSTATARPRSSSAERTPVDSGDGPVPRRSALRHRHGALAGDARRDGRGRGRRRLVRRRSHREPAAGTRRRAHRRRGRPVRRDRDDGEPDRAPRCTRPAPATSSRARSAPTSRPPS